MNISLNVRYITWNIPISIINRIYPYKGPRQVALLNHLIVVWLDR